MRVADHSRRAVARMADAHQHQHDSHDHPSQPFERVTELLTDRVLPAETDVLLGPMHASLLALGIDVDSVPDGHCAPQLPAAPQQQRAPQSSPSTPRPAGCAGRC